MRALRGREVAGEGVEPVGVEHERDRSTRRRCAATAAAVRSSRPRPGPTTSTEPVERLRAPRQRRARRARPRASAGRALVITSVPDAARRRLGAGDAAPHDAGAGTHRRVARRTIGAPVIPPDPPTTSTPDCHLCASGARVGQASRDVDGLGARQRGAASRRRCRCRRSSTSPACVRAGLEQQARLQRRERHRVRRRAPRGPSTAPVSPSTPDGMSTATHGPSTARQRARRHAASPSSAPRKPVPYIASTTRVGAQQRPFAELAVDAAVELEHVDAHAPRAAAPAPRRARRRRCCPCRTRPRPGGRRCRRARGEPPRRPRARRAPSAPRRACPPRSCAGRRRPSRPG